MSAQEFAAKIRSREPAFGYWMVLDAPLVAERVARLGYDYVAIDAQHGLMGYQGMLNNLIAIDAAGTSVGMVRVTSNDLTAIGMALDAGAVGVIVPLVNNAEEAAKAVHSAKYPPLGGRSYGPMRSALRIGPKPADSNATTLVFAMIETPQGLENVEQICRTPGLDGIYVGPSELCIAVGGRFPNDPEVADVFEAALARIARAAADAGVAAGIHNPSGKAAAARISQGYTYATVACDLNHIEEVARLHLADTANLRVMV